MKRIHQFIVFISMFVTLSVTTANAQNNLGLESVFPSGGFLENGEINLQVIVGLVFGILVGIGILWTVWRIIATAFKLSNANGEADKRKEVYTSIAEIAGAIVLIVLSFPLVSTIQGFVGSGTSAVLGTPCSGRASSNSPTLLGVYVEIPGSATGELQCQVTLSDGKKIVVTPDPKTTP